MSILEPLTHSDEIQELMDEADKVYKNAKDKFESQKKKTATKLEKLGEVKVHSWSGGMESFVDAFGAFKNVEMVKSIDKNTYFQGSDIDPKQMLVNMQQASLTAGEITKIGFAAVGTGALVGVASYGGAMMFASASTGTAIASLSGAAKTNATLAWFGGGSLSSGGLGIAGGKLILAGIVVLPILAVGTIIAAAKGKERLAEAKKINAEAKDSAAKMKIITTEMNGIAKMAGNYTTFIQRLDRKFQPFIDEINRIKNEHKQSDGERIDFNSLTLIEQKSLHLSWLMAQIYYHVLTTAILTEQGTISPEAKTSIATSAKEYRQIKKDTFNMTGEDARVGNIYWKPVANKMLLLNIIAVVIFVIGAVLEFKDRNIVLGIACLVSATIAFPIFIKFTDLTESKLFLWRLVRLICSLLLIGIIATVIAVA